jgi:hypothetical protein
MANTSKRQLRPLGDITLDMEKLLTEMTDQHELQHGEILALVHAWLQIHAEHAREQYTIGGHPIFYYGPEKY